MLNFAAPNRVLMASQFSRTFLFFFGILVALNLAQAFFTPLIYDESYYWYYAQDLAWGYFDHPPMVALMVKLGLFLFKGELGVRLVGCLLSAGTVLLLWGLIAAKEKDKYVPHFFLLLFGMVLFNAYGFLTLPDTPLLFFTALFLLLYKRFLEKASLFTALALGLTMAALLYSKYHAVLVILFVLISNLSLLRSRLAWVAVLVSILAYTPHLMWLYQNDFVSVKYHLFERPNQPYDFAEFTLGYFLNLAANFGLLFPWFFWALVKSKGRDKFAKALIYVSVGIILFFFMSSFHRRAQAQWVIAICVPMLVLTFTALLNQPGARKWVFRVGMVSCLILLYARLWLVHQPLFPVLSYETHGGKAWVKELKAEVGDIPVVFENSYRRAPFFAFYGGNTTFSFNNIIYRQNQYSIDHSESLVQNQRVAFVTPYTDEGDFSYTMPGGDIHVGWFIDNFKSYRKLRCTVEGNALDLTLESQMLKIYNPYPDTIPINSISLSIAYLDRYKDPLEFLPVPLPSGNALQLSPRDTTYLSCKFPRPSQGKPVYIKFSIAESNLEPGLNSESIKIKR